MAIGVQEFFPGVFLGSTPVEGGEEAGLCRGRRRAVIRPQQCLQSAPREALELRWFIRDALSWDAGVGSLYPCANQKWKKAALWREV